VALTFVARWFVRAEKKAEFVEALQELAAAIPQSLYASANYVNLTWNRQGDFIACESWNDEDAMNELRSSPVFHTAIRKMTACCHRPLELEILDPLAGDGGSFKRYEAGTADPRYYPPLGTMTAKVL
jgi:quinol monooxygenase YgiN